MTKRSELPLWRRVLCKLLGVPLPSDPPEPGDLITVCVNGHVVQARVVGREGE